MIQTNSDMKMMDTIQEMEKSVMEKDEAIKLEGGICDLKRFRDLVYLKSTLKHIFIPPGKGKGFWTLIIFPATSEDFSELRKLKFRGGCFTTVLFIALGVTVWLNIW